MSKYKTAPDNLASYPRLHYSLDQVASAGAVIASDITFIGNEVPDPVKQAFRVANNWREAHAFPMRSIHASIRYYVRSGKLDAITAARLKRMLAIRRKLRRSRLKLQRIQDLAGCRVILPSVPEVRALARTLKAKLPSVLSKENDYIADPKPDGYRSHHLIFEFRQRRRTPFDGKRVEVQVRTRLQHSWATTVEAVGLFRGEELKNQKGDPRWLRLFVLMSCEFAEGERCPVVADCPSSEYLRLRERSDSGGSGSSGCSAYAAAW